MKSDGVSGVSVGSAAEVTLVTLTAATGKRLGSPQVLMTTGGTGVGMTTKLYYTDETDTERLLLTISDGGTSGHLFFTDVGGIHIHATPVGLVAIAATLDTYATHTVKAWRVTAQFASGAGTTQSCNVSALEYPIS